MALLPVGPPPLGGRTVQDGDLVIAYERHDSMKAVRVDSKKGQLQNRHGNFAHRDWVGKVTPSALSPSIYRGSQRAETVLFRLVSVTAAIIAARRPTLRPRPSGPAVSHVARS